MGGAHGGTPLQLNMVLSSIFFYPQCAPVIITTMRVFAGAHGGTPLQLNMVLSSIFFYLPLPSFISFITVSGGGTAR